MTTEDVEHLLTDDGRRTLLVGNRVGPRREERDAEQEERQDARHRHERLTRVRRLGTAETSDAVGDRFESGQRRTAVGVGAQQGDERETHQDPGALRSKVMIDEVVLQGQRDPMERSGDLLRDPEDNRRRHHHDVEVRREGEVAARLFQPRRLP